MGSMGHLMSISVISSGDHHCMAVPTEVKTCKNQHSGGKFPYVGMENDKLDKHDKMDTATQINPASSGKKNALTSGLEISSEGKHRLRTQSVRSPVVMCFTKLRFSAMLVLRKTRKRRDLVLGVSACVSHFTIVRSQEQNPFLPRSTR